MKPSPDWLARAFAFIACGGMVLLGARVELVRDAAAPQTIGAAILLLVAAFCMWRFIWRGRRE